MPSRCALSYQDWRGTSIRPPAGRYHTGLDDWNARVARVFPPARGGSFLACLWTDDGLIELTLTGGLDIAPQWVIRTSCSLAALKRCASSSPPVRARALARTVPSLYQHPPRRQIFPKYFGTELAHLFKHEKGTNTDLREAHFVAKVSILAPRAAHQLRIGHPAKLAATEPPRFRC